MPADVAEVTRVRLELPAFIVVTAAAAIASFMVAPGPRGVFGAGLAVLMFAIARYDARHLIIPNALVAAAFAIGLAAVAVVESDRWPALGFALLRAGIVACAFLFVKLGYQALRGRHGLGMGDVKLAAVAGLWLDWLTILLAIDIAVVAALTSYVMRQYVRRRPLRGSGALPLGLYLAPAIWIGWLLELTLLAP